MVYAKRNADGEIVALLNSAEGQNLETVNFNDPDVIRFLASTQADHETLTFLQQSDLDLVRVVEDLIELMVDKDLIIFTELPTAAQEKLLGRKRARESLNEASILMVDESEII